MSNDRREFDASLDRKARIFWECRKRRHWKCPISRKVKPRHMVHKGETAPLGHLVTIYCECPCHARITNPQEENRGRTMKSTGTEYTYKKDSETMREAMKEERII